MEAREIVTPVFTVRPMPDQDRHGISESTRSMWAERVASRWNDLTARRDAELQCRDAYAKHRFSVPYVELSQRLQNAVNQEVHCVLLNFAARMTDESFDYLSHDRRAKLEPEVGTAGRS